MVVLLGHLPRDLRLSENESEALDAFKEMASDIAKRLAKKFPRPVAGNLR